MTAHQPSAKRRDIHTEITAKLIASIEQGPGNLQLPWRRSSGPLFMPVNARTEKAYNGINIVSLWVAAEVRGFTAPLWATYRQWQETGVQVRKGEASSLVVFYKEYETEPNAADDGRRQAPCGSCVLRVQRRTG